MVIFENSLVGGLLLRLWYVLCRWYEGSAVHRGLTALSRGWTRLFHGSAVMTFLTRDGTLPRAWRSSLACTVAETVVNLPAALLHWIYRKAKPVFDNSFFALLAFSMGEQVPAAIGWLMAVILIIPYERWDMPFL